MHITSIELRHTNPSLGPHETITTISLSVSEAHIAKVNQFVANSMVNGVMDLKAFLEAHLNEEFDSLKNSVRQNNDAIFKASGGTISDLTFYFEDGKKVKMPDVYREYRLSHFNPDFTTYMLEYGSKSSYSPGQLPRF